MSEIARPADVIRAIDEAVARFPIRDEGVHWLHAKEWDAIKREYDELRKTVREEIECRDNVMDERDALRLQLSRAKEWMQHERGCLSWATNDNVDCGCGLTEFLKEVGGEDK